MQTKHMIIQMITILTINCNFESEFVLCLCAFRSAKEDKFLSRTVYEMTGLAKAIDDQKIRPSTDGGIVECYGT